MDLCRVNIVHPEGMLDRDQRTAKCCVDKHVVSCGMQEGSVSRPEPADAIRTHRVLSQVSGRTSPHSSCKTRENGHFWKSLQRLKHALIVFAYLTIITFPTILSAPTINKTMTMRMDSHPKWINPCGVGADNGAVQYSDMHQISNEELLNQIVSQANIALSKAQEFQEDFVHKTFNVNSEQIHTMFKDKDYDWLPTKEIPKHLGQSVPKEHLETLELDPALLDSYGQLQKIAVGLEQVVWDQEDANGEFTSSFSEAENYLRTLLCEVQMTIMERNLEMRPDITRDIMGKEFRNMDNTSMNIRNWVIYRDYMNLLEYVKEAFEYLKTKLPKLG